MKASLWGNEFQLDPAQVPLGPAYEVDDVFNNSLCFGSLLENLMWTPTLGMRSLFGLLVRTVQKTPKILSSLRQGLTKYLQLSWNTLCRLASFEVTEIHQPLPSGVGINGVGYHAQLSITLPSLDSSQFSSTNFIFFSLKNKSKKKATQNCGFVLGNYSWVWGFVLESVTPPLRTYHCK